MVSEQQVPVTGAYAGSYAKERYPIRKARIAFYL